MPQNDELKVVREPNVMIPMRDGVRLATDIIRLFMPAYFSPRCTPWPSYCHIT